LGWNKKEEFNIGWYNSTVSVWVRKNVRNLADVLRSIEFLKVTFCYYRLENLLLPKLDKK